MDSNVQHAIRNLQILSHTNHLNIFFSTTYLMKWTNQSHFTFRTFSRCFGIWFSKQSWIFFQAMANYSKWVFWIWLRNYAYEAHFAYRTGRGSRNNLSELFVKDFDFFKVKESKRLWNQPPVFQIGIWNYDYLSNKLNVIITKLFMSFFSQMRVIVSKSTELNFLSCSENVFLSRFFSQPDLQQPL